LPTPVEAAGTRLGMEGQWRYPSELRPGLLGVGGRPHQPVNSTVTDVMPNARLSALRSPTTTAAVSGGCVPNYRSGTLANAFAVGSGATQLSCRVGRVECGHRGETDRGSHPAAAVGGRIGHVAARR
jgi:hypothetical protein